MREALYYRSETQGLICELCPKGCVIAEGGTGYCRVRRNRCGILYAENYEACSSYSLDPIEKKPLYHFYPGSNIFSIGTWGCNFACQFCQNWEIAQTAPPTVNMTSRDVVNMAKKAGDRNIGVAYTYSEPSVWYEFVLDTAVMAQDAGLKNILVTNGFINPKPLARLLPYIDAMNIDVKAFSEEYYTRICAGHLEDVKRTVEYAAAHCHVEITTLIIPTLNDHPHEIAALAAWLANLNPDMPLHLSRYFPRYRMNLPPTPVSTLEEVRQTARQYLRYVYIGNVGSIESNTMCPRCGHTVIDRVNAMSVLASNHTCPTCGEPIAITGEVWF